MCMLQCENTLCKTFALDVTYYFMFDLSNKFAILFYWYERKCLRFVEIIVQTYKQVFASDSSDKYPTLDVAIRQSYKWLGNEISKLLLNHI